MSKLVVCLGCTLALVLLLLAALPACAEKQEEERTNLPTAEEAKKAPEPRLLADVERSAFKKRVDCLIRGPAEVQGYRVQCPQATHLDFAITDCAIPGDHWSLKGKNWDSAPNTAVTTSPGPVYEYGVFGRVYNYGGTPENPKNVDAYLQCSYLHGVDVFPALSYVIIVSDGQCTVTPDTIRSRIDRSP